MSRPIGPSLGAIYDSSPVPTAGGAARVRARGIQWETRWGSLRRLRPIEVRVTRPDGRCDRLPIDDPNGRTLYRFTAVGACVALTALCIERIRTP